MAHGDASCHVHRAVSVGEVGRVTGDPGGRPPMVGSRRGASSDCCTTVSCGPPSGISAVVESHDQTPTATAITAAVAKARLGRRSLAGPSRSRRAGPRGELSGCHSSPTASWSPWAASPYAGCMGRPVSGSRGCHPCARSRAEGSRGAEARMACSLSVRNLNQTSSPSDGVLSGSSGDALPPGSWVATSILCFPAWARRAAGRRPVCRFSSLCRCHLWPPHGSRPAASSPDEDDCTVQKILSAFGLNQSRQGAAPTGSDHRPSGHRLVRRSRPGLGGCRPAVASSRTKGMTRPASRYAASPKLYGRCHDRRGRRPGACRIG